MVRLRNAVVTAAFIGTGMTGCSFTHHGIAHYSIWHCDECDDGDYDLCEACTSKGVHCYDGSHWLSHREIVAGKFVVREPSPKPSNHRICNCCLGRGLPVPQSQ